MNRFLRDIIEFITENIFTVMFIIYFATSVLEVGGIVFDVKHDEKETKVSIETPQKPKDTEQKQKVTESPQSSW
jgi:hypothetical protein